MNLTDAVKMGRFCGLTTVDECVSNIERHSMSLFKYTEIPKELRELYNDLTLYRRGEYPIDFKAIDTENKEELDRMFAAEDEWHANNDSIIGEDLEVF